MNLPPFRLLPSFREKIWGSQTLEPWFPDSAAKIGEVWLTADDNCVEDGRRLAELMREYGRALTGAWTGASFPILIKFLFTTDRLSIQVHPDEEQGRAMENSPGKTEMWYVLRADPGASLALGFREPLTRPQLHAAALSGEIEQLVRWFPVRAGDTFFNPAGVVHSIGAGLALCEIQQNSDVTYRLYDYGRPRELRLEKGLTVSSLEPHPGPSRPETLRPGRLKLAACPYFVTELLEWHHSAPYHQQPGRMEILVFLEGSGAIAGNPVSPGACWLAPAAAAPFDLAASTPLRVLRVYIP
jgi:mannose-6-phosphate isomerase